MQIGNKIFPYPTLNNMINLSGYNESSTFKFKFDTTDNGELIVEDGNVIFRNICFILNNDKLNKLYAENKLYCALIVECSSTVFRKIFHISNIPKDILINIKELNKIVFVSAYMYASEHIKGYTNDDFIKDYDDYTFDIEKYDILVIDDGYKFRIDIDQNKDNKVDSIFTIVKKDSNDHQLSYDNDKEKIKIYLSPEYYDYYETIKYSSSGINVNFAILLIPALAASLSEIKLNINEDYNIEDIIDKKRWFKSVCFSYEKVAGLRLDIDEFQEIDCVTLAQLVLNNATCNGLKDFADLLINGTKAGEEDE